MNKEEKEFEEKAKEIYRGRYSPTRIRYKDIHGEEKLKEYNGDVFYSTIWQYVKDYTTQKKRSRAHDYIYDYLIEHNMKVHS